MKVLSIYPIDNKISACVLTNGKEVMVEATRTEQRSAAENLIRRIDQRANDGFTTIEEIIQDLEMNFPFIFPGYAIPPQSSDLHCKLV